MTPPIDPTNGPERTSAGAVLIPQDAYNDEALVGSLDISEIATAEITCGACPVQVEGYLRDGRRYYFRFRHGLAGIGIGTTTDDAVTDQHGDVSHGDQWDGFLDADGELASVFRAAWVARLDRSAEVEA